MAVYSRYAKVLEADGSPIYVRAALALINQALDEALAESEGEFDEDTRWARDLVRQGGFDGASRRQANLLAQRRPPPSMASSTPASSLPVKGNQVRLLDLQELAADWDRATDVRVYGVGDDAPTVSECSKPAEKVRVISRRTGAQAGQQAGVPANFAYQLCHRLRDAKNAPPRLGLQVAPAAKPAGN